MALLAHHPLDGRPSYQPMPHRYGDRWILFAGHHAGEAVNSLNGKLEGNGTSVLDVTDPRNPVYLAHIAAPPWAEHGSMSLGTGAQHVQVCNGTDLPSSGTPPKAMLGRTQQPTSQPAKASGDQHKSYTLRVPYGLRPHFFLVE